MSTVTSRFLPHTINESDAECLSQIVRGSEINVFSDGYIQEIQLNIFPPSAVYSTNHHCHLNGEKVTAATTTTTRCKYCGSCCQQKSNVNGNDEANCLSIDVIQEVNHSGSGSKSATSSGYGGGTNDSEGDESHKKTTEPGIFSHIAFKRSDSILHIAIGNSSKVMKRRKRRHRWIFAKLYKLSRGCNRKSPKECYSPEVTNDGKTFHLNNMNGLSVINDDIVISINKKSHPMMSSTTTQQQTNDTYQNQFRSVLGGDLAHATELDIYMNEIKMREMG